MMTYFVLGAKPAWAAEHCANEDVRSVWVTFSYGILNKEDLTLTDVLGIVIHQ